MDRRQRKNPGMPFLMHLVFFCRERVIRKLRYRKSLMKQMLDGAPFMRILRPRTICCEKCARIYLTMFSLNIWTVKVPMIFH